MKKTIKNNNNLWLRCGGNISRGNHLFYNGGIDQGFLDQLAIDDAKYATKQLNNNWSKAGDISNTIGSTLGAVGTMYNAFRNNSEVADTSGIKNAINTFTNNPIESSSREALSNQWVNTINPRNDYTSREFRASDGQRIGNTIGSVASGATAGAQIGGLWGAVAGAAIGLGSGIGGIINGNIKARKEANKLNEQANKAILNRQYNNIAAAQQLDEEDAFNFLSNYYNNGGYMNLFERGGYLGQTHGSNWSNNVQFINEGNTHENNKYEGVQIGVDQEGNPDLVEEGEVIFNDYVFSNRLYPTKEQLAQFNLPEKYDNHTFAWIASELSKESEERPNDNISINGLNDSMNKLMQLHELVRQENEVKESNKFDLGGDLKKAEKKAANYASLYYKKGSQEWTKAYNERYEELSKKINDKYDKKESFRQAEEYLKSLYPNTNITMAGNKDSFYLESTNNINSEHRDNYNAILRGEKTFKNGKLSDNNVNVDDKYFRISFDNYGPELKKPDGDKDEIKGDPVSDTSVSTRSTTKTNTPEAPETNIDYDSIDQYINRPWITDPNAPILTRITPQEKAYTQEDLDYIHNGKLPELAVENKQDVTNTEEPKESFDYSTLLRYAPILGNALAYLGNRKDYSDVNSFMEQTANPRSVAFTPLGNYIRPEYISPWEMTSPIERQASATRSAIMNNSGNNRAAATAGLVGSDYNTLGLLGQALLQGKQYNNQQRLQAADFNRGTDQFNSQGAMQAQAANMSLNEYGLQRALQEYNMRNQIDMAYNQARSTNLTSLFNNLGNIGRENYIMNQINSNRALFYDTDWTGRSKYKGQ